VISAGILGGALAGAIGALLGYRVGRAHEAHHQLAKLTGLIHRIDARKAQGGAA